MGHTFAMSTRVMIDGRLVPDGETPVVPLDDGLVRGDGVFEGLRLYGRTPRTIEAHLDRMQASAAGVGLAFDRALIAGEIAEIACAASAPECGLRVILTRGGHRILREEALIPEAPHGWVVHPVRHRVTPLLVGSKTLSYAANMQAARLATTAGADTALFVEADRGLVLECPVASLVWLEGDDLVAPPLALGVLDSITRRLICEVTTLHARERTLSDLAAADGAMVISTVLESRIVNEIQGVGTYEVGGRRVTQIASALAELCATGDPQGARVTT